MVQAQKISDWELYPGRVSGADDPLRYSGIIEWLLGRQESFIGSSYYYIRKDQDQCVLCCLSITGGCLYSVDVIDHIGYGISDEDIDDAVRTIEDDPIIPGHFHIDIHIESKLRTLLDVAA
jgi:hypothetical protein